jgi:hypothetical protein
MASTKVKLAGQEYDIQSLPIMQARAWRQELRAPINVIATLINNIDLNDLTNVQNVEGLVVMVKDALMTVVDSVDIFIDLLFAFSPVLAADRERIEANATDEEALAALMQIVKVAYPLGAFATFLTSGTSGQKGRTTSRNGR